jgi:energy-coupling factor transporter ATP-binding protein EcfA2
MEGMKELHEKVLRFLLDWREKRDPDLRFTLRSTRSELVQKGYWFQGNEDYLSFSFWNGIGFENFEGHYFDLPVIQLELRKDGQFKITLNDKGDQFLSDVITQTAEKIGGFRMASWAAESAKGRIVHEWIKQYPVKEVLYGLQYFLEHEKKQFDLLSFSPKNSWGGIMNAWIDPIHHKEFESSLRSTLALRAMIGSVSQLNPTDRKIQIISMKLSNAGLFSNLSLNFGQRATALIGENGCGKTTILRAVALGILGTGNSLINANSPELQNFPKIKSIDEEAMPTYAGAGEINISYQFKEKTFEGNEANVIEFSQPNTAGNVRFKSLIAPDGIGLPEGPDPDGWLPFLIIGYPQRYGKKSDGTNILKRAKSPNAYDVLPLIFKTEDNRIDSLKIWISETWNTGNGKQQRVKDLFALISDLLSIDGQPRFEIQVKHAVSAQKIVITTPENPEGILYDMLSTGLENLFGWVGHLISRMHEAYPKSEQPLAEPAIVFIDEIDNYLHPEIQARLMPILLERFPKAQFIFTSHSPVILASLPNEGSKAYRIEGGKAIEIMHFYGKTVQDILHDQYGILKRPATAVQRRIDEMGRALALGQIELAKPIFEELKAQLGADDPAILDAEYHLQRQ